jgi:phenylalanyl-tRNA synthetase alpha chain
MTDLEALLQQATSEVLKADDLKVLDHCRVHYLGKKGKLTEQLKTLGQLPAAERPLAGQQINIVKEKIQEVIEQKAAILQKNQIAQQLATESIDITLPGRAQQLGNIHPVTKTRDRIASWTAPKLKMITTILKH